MPAYPDLTSEGFSSRVVLPSGDGTNGVMVVAEAPGENEDRDGIPLHPKAAAGSMFERILRRAGLTRDRFTLTNVVWQRPPNNHLENTRYEQMAVAAWRPHLERLIEERQPKAIVTLGNVALRALTAYGGKGATISQVHSYVLNSNIGDAWVVPAFHPSYLVQGGQHLIGAVRFVIERALGIAREGFIRRPTRYIWDNYDALLEFERGFDPTHHVLSYDIETPESHKLDEDQLEAELQPQAPEAETDDADDDREPAELDASYNILRVSLCYDAERAYAVSVPWQEPFITVVKRMLASAQRRRVWNISFDDPRLRANGVTLGGHAWDSMECWSYLQRSLPRALSFVTPFYGWCLNAATRVRLWDTQKTLKISDIVTTKAKVVLEGCDHFGRPIPVHITDWHRHEAPNQKWLAIQTENTTQSIYCTPDHGIWTKRGLVAATHLSTSDSVRIYKRGHNSMIHGTILGDGSVDRHGRLRFTHCKRQRQWAQAKATSLGCRLTQGRDKNGNENYGTEGNVGHSWEKLFYRTDRKKLFIPPPDDAALAVWYCDDGHRLNQSPLGQPSIKLGGFVNWLDAVEWAKAWFGDACISVYRAASSNRQFNIIGKGRRAFYEAVSLWVHPSMDYKLPEEYRGRYNGWLDRTECQWAKVISVGEYKPPKWNRRRNIRYCVTVDHPTHRFFTNGGLVTNCGEPWKHLNISEPGFYSCADAHALQQNGDGIERDLEREGKLELVRRHVVETYEVLTQMSRNGLPYSTTKAKAFGEKLATRLSEREATLQTVVPECVRPSKQKHGYKKPPKDTSGLVRRSFALLGQDMTDEELERQPTAPLAIAQVERWCVLEPFLPTSPQQVLALVKHYGHKAGRNRKTKRDTVDREVLKKLIRQARSSRKVTEQAKGETYQLIKECRKLSKVIGTYVNGWVPARDGRVHATPGFWGKMYRVSWRRPNIAATIADKDEEAIAAGFRECVEARDGHLLVEADWKSMEAVLVGYFAEDADYMRLARLGVHDFMGIHMAGGTVDLSLPDDELRRQFKAFRRDHEKLRDDAKHTIHGCVTGDHEVLTKDGWVPFADYAGEPVAQWDTDGSIKFVSPSKVTRHKWNGALLSIVGIAISVQVTPDHAIPVASNNENKVRRFRADSLPPDGRIPVAGCYQGELTLEQNDVALAVATQADATLYGRRATFHLVRARKQVALRHLLKNYNHTEEPCGCHPTGKRFKVTLPDTVLSLLTPSKEFSNQVLHLDNECSQIFLDQVTKWDGHESGGIRHRREYITTSKRSAVIVQTVAHLHSGEALFRRRKCGKGHLGRKQVYCVSFNRRTYAHLSATRLHARPFNGMVYCVTVPSGFFLVRHRGRISVTGNTNYGMRPLLMADLYEMTVARAKQLQTLYFDLFPKVKAWQQRVMRQADKEGCLTNPFGYKMWFWDVFRWDTRKYARLRQLGMTDGQASDQAYMLGKDAKSAVSFLPRDTGAGMLKEALLRLRPLAEEGVLLACAHDSLLCECREERVYEVGFALREAMEAGVPQCGGLSIGVELSVGKVWDKKQMKPLELPAYAMVTS